MAGVEQRNVSNEEFMEEVARYVCVYHRNSNDQNFLLDVRHVVLMRFSRKHKAPVILTLQLTEKWQKRALRLFVIVPDYMETTLFAIVWDPRFAIRDHVRSYGNQP